MSSTSDEKQPQGGEQGQATGAAAAPQSEAGSAERAPRHSRGRRRGGRSEQRQQGSQHQQRRSESGLDMDELRELTELFSSHALTEFEFENAEIRIRLSRNPAPSSQAPVAALPAAHNPFAAMHSAAEAHAPVAHTQQPAPATPAPAPEAPAAPEAELHVITSPIVGTFYRAASPNADVFVKPGSKVENDTVVCIIEAMKLMNEVQAETTGTVEKIYVENGQPVEYGQPLFGIKK